MTQGIRRRRIHNECPDDVSTHTDQQVRLLRCKLAGQLGQPRRVRVGIAKRHINVASLDEAAFRKRIPQRLVDRSKFRSTEHEPADPVDLGALGTRRERPCGRRAAEQRDELAPSHVEHGASSPAPGRRR
jgi:hypothetical protein